MKKNDLELITNNLYFLLNRKPDNFSILFKNSLRYFCNYKNTNNLRKTLINFILNSHLKTANNVHFLYHIKMLTQSLILFVEKLLFLQCTCYYNINFYSFKNYPILTTFVYVIPFKNINYYYITTISFLIIIENLMFYYINKPLILYKNNLLLLSLLFKKYYKNIIPYHNIINYNYYEEIVTFEQIISNSKIQRWHIKIPYNQDMQFYLFKYIAQCILFKHMRALRITMSLYTADVYHPTMFNLAGIQPNINIPFLTKEDKIKILNKAKNALDVILSKDIYPLNDNNIIIIEAITPINLDFKDYTFPILFKNNPLENLYLEENNYFNISIS